MSYGWSTFLMAATVMQPPMATAPVVRYCTLFSVLSSGIVDYSKFIKQIKLAKSKQWQQSMYMAQRTRNDKWQEANSNNSSFCWPFVGLGSCIMNYHSHIIHSHHHSFVLSLCIIHYSLFIVHCSLLIICCLSISIIHPSFFILQNSYFSLVNH